MLLLPAVTHTLSPPSATEIGALFRSPPRILPNLCNFRIYGQPSITIWGRERQRRKKRSLSLSSSPSSPRDLEIWRRRRRLVVVSRFCHLNCNSADPRHLPLGTGCPLHSGYFSSDNRAKFIFGGILIKIFWNELHIYEYFCSRSRRKLMQHIPPPVFFP